MGSTFLESPSGTQKALFPVIAHLPSEEQVCCGALEQTGSALTAGADAVSLLPCLSWC